MNIVNLSGGKDSTYMLWWMIQNGIPVHRILFADVGDMAEFPEMYEYLARVERYFGRSIEVVKSSKHTARSMFYGYPTRGEHTDEIRGFPKTIGAACRYRSWLKVDPLEAATGTGHDVFIGIAADESHRSRSLEYAKGKNTYHFPLVDEGIKEQDCLDGLRVIGLYNPLYDYFDRLGCFWCPKQPLASLRSLYHHFPQHWKTLREMEEAQGRPFKHRYPGWELEVRFELEKKGEYRRKNAQKGA